MTLLLPFGPLHGISSALVKQAAKFLTDMESAELYDFAVSLGISQRAAEPLWRRFIDDGYIAQDVDGRFIPTDRMEMLPMARFGKPLPRKKAEALLQQAIDNAVAINAEPPTEALYYITRLAVFGSFLDESKQGLGDLDLAWEIEERPGVRAFAINCMMSNRDSVAPTRGRFRPKSAFVRLENMDNLLSLGCPYRVVYELDSQLLAELREARMKRREEAQAHLESLDELMGTWIDRK